MNSNSLVRRAVKYVEILQKRKQPTLTEEQFMLCALVAEMKRMRDEEYANDRKAYWAGKAHGLRAVQEFLLLELKTCTPQQMPSSR